MGNYSQNYGGNSEGYGRRSYGGGGGRSYGSRPSRYGGGGGRGYSDRGYSDRGGYSQRPPAKRTGAKFISKAKNDKPCIAAWKVIRGGGIMSMVATPTAKGMVSEQCEQWVCKITLPNQKPYLVTGFWNVNTRKLTIPDLSLVANPGVSGGGYFGTFIKSKRR